ncbi:hypothetical protein Lesp02_68840 [Lentzea sp. NBRC 105346]|uniref:NlpC/P60 family protein n=1 Tax=Lentzea sp. NBRC 105346 TaxID=3032205 RepID=UPI0024A203FB|nr:NlpC/P60 family protein [Lentzea sp. NBRC 105346]GLZ34697.1 hypothetical protein Lesp02_68840 [Lentzea sp. NBRC 105346]
MRRNGKSWPRWARIIVLVAVIALSGAAVVYIGARKPAPDLPKAVPLEQSSPAPALSTSALRFERVDGPPRTVVRDERGAVVATLTDGARTATIIGPARTFKDPKFTPAQIDSTVWVRLLDQPWVAGAEQAEWFRPWLDRVRADQSPDALATAMQYVDGAPAESDAKSVRFRGDAAFGPVAASGAGRLEQSDFQDYLGVSWTFPDAGTRKPKPAHSGALDCSGFVRIVYGYRLGFPLLGNNDAGPGLPRRAYAIAESAPGVVLVPNRKQRVTDYAVLQPGDLVFFEVEDADDQLDHAGIYLGVDSTGHHRFVSSRERANGPTFGDLGGTSLLDDGGMYSRGFRSARRI